VISFHLFIIFLHIFSNNQKTSTTRHHFLLPFTTGFWFFNRWKSTELLYLFNVACVFAFVTLHVERRLFSLRNVGVSSIF